MHPHPFGMIEVPGLGPGVDDPLGVDGSVEGIGSGVAEQLGWIVVVTVLVTGVGLIVLVTVVVDGAGIIVLVVLLVIVVVAGVGLIVVNEVLVTVEGFGQTDLAATFRVAVGKIEA
jgi:hypothetical protein